jgi:outer membrane lipoprotein-sorting protein
MKKLLLCVIATTMFLASQAKNDAADKAEPKSENISTVQLSGLVVDKDSKEALVGVEVQIEGLNVKTYTDFDGKFTFSNLKPGEYNVTASYISYQKNVVELVDANNQNNQVSIKLEASY